MSITRRAVRSRLRSASGAAAAALVLSLGLAACGGPSSSNGGGGTGGNTIEATLAFALSSGFDPDNASSAVATAANQHIFEGLIDLDPVTREPYLALAGSEPEESADGLSWTVQLRDGAKFSDGSDVTADDVAHSFMRVIEPEDPAAPPLMAGFVNFIKKVEAVDATTVEFTLKSPFPLFEQRISVIKVVPKALTGDAEASEKFDTAPIGSGPYQLDSASETVLKLSKNEYYNGPRPAKADAMTWNTNTDGSARIADLQGGRVQAIEAVPYLNVDSLGDGFEVAEKQAFNQAFLMFNNSAAPFDDKRVRQALHYALDKDKIVDTALNGFGTPASSYLDEGNPSYQEAATVYGYDPQKAEQLLAEAGAEDLQFELVTTDASFIKDIAPLVIEQWKQVGVTATLNTVPSSAVYGELVPSEKFRVLLASGDPSVFGPDPDLLMRWFYYGTTWPEDRMRWSSPNRQKVADLLDRAAATDDESARDELWKQVLDIVADDVPLYPILHTKVVTAYDGDELSDFDGPATTGLYFLDASRS
ncbi:ABC transporter substrate-binding protein [Nocardioides deserti]|uniref:ABC transporter substrate-binding protein n=1 Tax=Nocardioides deserti TaxID=1588644 RepID=UPI0019C50EBD|nr:ABC transporter substrate-binding protein [Nocardioides deserti]GGO68087.1 ABC transporter substrate-binding protein [Nocardioides deserti]